MSQPEVNGTRTIDEIGYGGFWLRAAAVLIDWIVVAVGISLLAVASSLSGVVIGWVIPWVYEALLVSGNRQATLGKMAVGLIVTDGHGARLTFARATGRHFAKYLSGLLFGVGFILAAFTARKQALHDLIVDTVVIYGNRT